MWVWRVKEFEAITVIHCGLGLVLCLPRVDRDLKEIGSTARFVIMFMEDLWVWLRFIYGRP